jgi:hypothetical protein
MAKLNKDKMVRSNKFEENKNKNRAIMRFARLMQSYDDYISYREIQSG